MTYLQNKKLTFMSIVNRIKGFVRSVSGILPLILSDCVDENSLISYSISGNSIQNGTPSPDAPVEVESVGERTKNLVKVVDTTYTNVAIAKSGEIIVSEQWSMDKYYYIPMTADILTTGNTYTLSFGGNIISTKGSSNVEITFEDGTTKQLWGNWRKLSFTAVSPVKKIQFVLSNTDTGIYRNTPIKIMLEEGSDVTDYEPYGYKIPVVCSGKNVVGGYNYIDQTTRYYSVITVSQPYTFKQGVTYTISFDTPNTNKAVCFSNYQYTEQGLQNVALNGRRRSLTVTPTRDLSVSALISVTSVVGEGNSAGLCSNCMIEIGATATDYEPYVEPVTTNIYLDEPLRKATTWGYNCQDYIDFEKQKVIRRIGKYELRSLSWVTENQAYAHIYKNTSCNFYGFRFQISDMLKTTRIGGYCNMFRVDADNNVSTKPYGMWIGVSGDRTCYFCLPEIYNAGSTDYERVLAFNEWMKGRKPIEIYYILETARETSVAIPELPTVKGTTVYTVDTSVQPTNMSVTYYATSKE